MTDNPLELIKRLTEALRIQADDFGTDSQLLRDANSFIARREMIANKWKQLRDQLQNDLNLPRWEIHR